MGETRQVGHCRCVQRHIYGLPGNTPAQQREADEGTLMAVRSGWLREKQVMSCRKRAVPEVPTRKTHQVLKILEALGNYRRYRLSSRTLGHPTVEFNTCAYQTQQKRRWFKPARWIGKLESSASLAKVCKCQLWGAACAGS